MGRKSRVKGARAELEICRILSAWWMNDPSMLKGKAESLPIRRTPLSGGWSTPLSGDLVAVGDAALDIGVFNIEVKHQERWSFDGIFRKKWVVDRWWGQCTSAASKDGRVPILIFTKNRYPWFICLNHTFWYSIKQKISPDCLVEKFSVYIQYQGRVIFPLSEFCRAFAKEDCLRVFR